MPRDWYINEDEADDFQIQLLNTRIDTNVVVKGCAGSGKTIIALWRAKKIAESGLGSYYFIVFTKALREFIKDGVQELELDPKRILYVWEWDKKQNAPSADFIIVDEIQDFNERDIRKFKNKANKAFMFWGDTDQGLYAGLGDGRDLSMEQISTIVSQPTRELAYNHRLPTEIAEYAQYISKDDTLKARCRREGGFKPRVYHYDSFEKQLDRIIELIDERDLEDIGILFPKNVDVKMAYEYFINKGMDCEAKFTQGGKKSFMDLDFDNYNPKLMTFHSAKGLQFESVFIPNCNDIDDRDDMWRNPLFVAFTRAYKNLFILYSGSLPSYFDDIPSHLYESNTEIEDTVLF